ncbi:MAG: hypothetical protein ACFFCS_03390 [Candidatus Hodarchaeota archaeon]
MPFIFFIVLESFPRVNKKLIDIGQVTREEASLCDIIRSTFFISHGIRKERELWLFFSRDDFLVRIDGQRVRYLGPDERSNLMLLMKANDQWEKVRSRTADAWVESTPGIDLLPETNVQQGIQRLIDYQENFRLCIPTFVINHDANAPIVKISESFLEQLKKTGISLVLTEKELDINQAIRNALFRDADITTRTRLIDLPTKIMVLNLIEDNLA